MERPKTPTIMARPVHKRQSITKLFPFSRMSCRARVNAPTPRNNRHINSMIPITTNSTPAITAPTMPQGKPPSTCQNQAQKFTTSLLAAPTRSDGKSRSVPNNSCSQGILQGAGYQPPHATLNVCCVQRVRTARNRSGSDPAQTRISLRFPTTRFTPLADE